MVKLAENKDIEELSHLRIEQQMDDWKEEFEDNYNLLERTKNYLHNHLNKDLFMFVKEVDSKIVATCGLQVIDYLPQCNDNGRQGYICNVYTKKDYRRMGIQTELIKKVTNLSVEKGLCELGLSSDSEVAVRMYKKLGFQFDEMAMVLKL